MPNLHQGFYRGTSSNTEAVIAKACFAETENLKASPSLQFDPDQNDGQIFLGVVDAEVHQHRLKDQRLTRYVTGGQAIGCADDRHILTVAGSRGGKGRGAIVPNLIHYSGSVLTIDPKGDLASITADWRANVLGQKTVVLDPFDTAKDALQDRYSGGFNPMTILTPDSPSLIDDAGLIADALIVGHADDKNPHWNESARLFLATAILHVATDGNYIGKRHLVSVHRFLMKLDDNLEAEIVANKAANETISDAAFSFFAKPDDERGSILSTLRRHIEFIGLPRMHQVLTKNSFDLRELKTRKTSIYLSLPATKMGICSGWLRLFVNLTLNAMEIERTRPEVPVLLCLDEFAVLGHMKALESAIGQIAGLDCKLWPILQDLGQLEALYGRRWQSFMGNCGIIQFFGNSDLQTLEWISKRLGQTSVTTSSSRNPAYNARTQSGETGASWGEQSHPLMTPEEIACFFGRDDQLVRQLIIRPSFQPMVLQRAYYDQHELFEPYRNFIKNL